MLLWCLSIVLLIVSSSTATRPSYIPADHEPIIEGDFNEYIELWELKKASNWAGFIRWKNGSTGVQVASGVASKSGTDTVFPIPCQPEYVYVHDVDHPMYSYEVWSTGKVSNAGKEVECRPKYNGTDTEYMFFYKDWLFLNSTHVMNMEKVYNKMSSCLEYEQCIRSPCPEPQTYDEIPEHPSLNLITKEQIREECFGDNASHCAVNMDYCSHLEKSQTDRLVLHSREMTLIMRTRNEGKKTIPYYVLKYQHKHFYFPEDLNTLKPNDTVSVMGKSPEDDTLVKRFWMFPVFSKGDKFLKRRLQFTTTSTTTTTTAPRLFFV